MQAYARRAAPLTDRVVGAIAAELPNRPDDAACNVRAGELVADAQRAATASPGAGGARIALVNRGGLRTGLAFASGPAGEGDSRVTYGEAFATQPFGNALVTMTLTARELKDAQAGPAARGSPASRSRRTAAARRWWTRTARCRSPTGRGA